MSLTLWDLIEPLLPKRRPRPGKEPASTGAIGVSPGGVAGRAPSKPPAPLASAVDTTARARRKRASVSGSSGHGARTGAPAAGAATAATVDSMQARYDRVTQAMLSRYSIRVRKWRTSMSGIAWYVTFRDGSIARLIEAPRPKGPMSAAVFLHEIGHHAIGFNTYKPRCLEEYHAWRWSLEAMEAEGLNVTDQVRLRMHQSLYYAVQKAKRRGIKEVPRELEPFLTKPPRSRKRASARGVM